MRFKGTWKKVTDQGMKPGPIQAQVVNRIDDVQKILQASYPDPRGIEAHWSRDMSANPLLKNGPIPYELAVGLFVYHCNAKAKKMEAYDETGTWVYVYFNQFNWFMDKIEDLIIENNPAYLLRKMAGGLNGIPLYEGVYNETTNTGTRTSRTVLISRTGQNPYIPVTKIQYLKAFVENIERERAKSFREINHSKELNSSKENKEKQKRIHELMPTLNLDSLEEVDKESFKKLIKDSNEQFDDLLKPAQNLLLNIGEEEGRKPALLYNNFAGNFEGFATDSIKGRMVVRLNTNYFKMGLMKYVPQFLVVYWSWDDLIPTNYWKGQFEKNLNLITLKGMLDK